VIPANVAGMNAEALDDELTALGFKKIVYNSDTGKTVLLLSNWTVTGIDNAGAEQAVYMEVLVHLTKALCLTKGRARPKRDAPLPGL
jgi:hypothetical protein